MISKHITALLLLFSTVVFSQELTVKERITNPSNIINDGVIEVTVDGGVPPYTYKWSNQDTPLHSNKAVGLVEGVPYTITVTDAAGTSVTNEYKVPAEAIT